ncbi:hypothetical protein BUALT_Bualt16G0011400 [Buddleja alternifolia]|uniref:Gibberellin-regulated protein 14 n=1 Tax=Buddleja alternifolia TaxID=168488 RepID=A0AAV6WIQ1_9LAMI|nr:hypothetical protein BUALT_Bualt16G0011400 [Buddleja alternifolia]
MAIKSTLFLLAFVLLATRMASSMEEIDDIETEAAIYAPDEDPVDAYTPVKAWLKPPTRKPPARFPPRGRLPPKSPRFKPPRIVLPPVHLPPVHFPPVHLPPRPGVPAQPGTPVDTPPAEGDYPSNPSTQDTETNTRKTYEVSNKIKIHHVIKAGAEADQTMRALNMAAVQAPSKPPVASPPTSAFPPVPSTQDCLQMCMVHCPKKPKRPCMKNCTVCCRENKCVPEVTPNCKWDKAMFKGKEIKCT